VRLGGPRLDAELIARTIIIIVALAVAVAAGLVFLPIAALVDPVTRAAGAAFSASGIFALLVTSFSWDGPDQAAGAFLLALWTIAVMICVAPVLLVALIGEVAGIASGLWYVGATGLIAAGLPWIVRIRHLGEARADAAAGEVEGRLALVFFLTGALSGFVYWLIAGHKAARALPQR
jgi:hypothetical protein